MKIASTRRIVLLPAMILAAVGLVIFVNANQNVNSGQYFSTMPSLGYEGKFLSYSEIAIVGSMITGVGILLGLASIGIRKWSGYVPEEFYIDNVKTVGISVASVDYEKDRNVIHEVMRRAELMFHAKNEFSIEEQGFRMGWSFFILHVMPPL